MRKKNATSVRVTPEATRLLKQLAKSLGISQAGVIEIAVRRLAEIEKVK
jgi:predicted DNA-binding protein